MEKSPNFEAFCEHSKISKGSELIIFLRFFTNYSTEGSLDQIIELAFTSIDFKCIESIFSLFIPYKID